MRPGLSVREHPSCGKYRVDVAKTYLEKGGYHQGAVAEGKEGAPCSPCEWRFVRVSELRPFGHIWAIGSGRW